MSLRAEYKVTAELDLESLWTVFVHHKGKEVRRMTKVYTSGLIQESARLINEHMAQVTRSLGLGSRAMVTEEEDAEQDRLAHKADHDNQCEKDRS